MTSYRFCFVTTFYPPYSFGGDAIGVQRLARALARRGHDVTVISDVNAYTALSRTVPPEPTPAADGVTEVRLRSRLGMVSPALTQQSGRPLVHRRTLRRMLDQGRFDIVNFHNISLVGGPGILSYGGDAAKIYMAHEHWLVCPSHVLWRHNRERCPGRECIRCVLHYHRPPQLWRYTGWLTHQLESVDVFIAMSEFSREKHREFGFPREMDVVPYFLPDGEASRPPSTDASPHDRPFFLFVGRLERLKGLDDVIPAFLAYGAADLVIAGTGEHEPTLKRLANQSAHVRFLGNVPNAALDCYYRHAIALIVPSVGFETFGIVLIEAFRHGTPVIARRLGPFPEIVRAAQAGELFDSKRELLEALTRFQTDSGYRNGLANAGREAFVRRWTESAVMPMYMEVVSKALRHRDVRLGRVPRGTVRSSSAHPTSERGHS